MSAMQHSRLGHTPDNKEGDGDAASYSSDTSRWSVSTRHHRGGPEHPRSDSECSLLNQETLSALLSPRYQDSVLKEARMLKESRQKTRQEKLSLPPIKTVNIIHPRVQSASMNFIRELRSQMWDLQQQLREARNENKLLKQLQHRHTMALQYFQHTESSIGQILARHNSEAKTHQKLLRETRMCRDNLIRQLQVTESKLLKTTATLQQLQKLNRDQNLLERAELTQKLAKANGNLENKERKIQDMEKYLELCQASFNRQIIAENKKAIEARNLSYFLQEQNNQLTIELMDKGKEMDKKNLYFHKSNKFLAKKGRENKMVQTEGLEDTASNVSSSWDVEFSGSEDMVDQPDQPNRPRTRRDEHKKEHESLVTEDLGKKENDMTIPEETEICADLACITDQVSEKNEDVQEIPSRSPKPPLQDLSVEESEIPEVLEVQNQQPNCETSGKSDSNNVDVAEARKKKCQLPRIRQSYIFKQSTENLHNGLPAYTHIPESSKSSFKVDILRRGVQNLCLLSSKFKCVAEKKSTNQNNKNIHTQKRKNVQTKPRTEGDQDLT